MIGLMDPAACAARVWQRDGDHLRVSALDAVLAADEILEGQSRQEAFDGESPDGDEEPRPEQPELVVQPAGTGSALRGRRHAVATATWTRTGITTRDRRDVDPLARRGLVEADSLEPAEERFAGPAGECPAAGTLDLSRRLAHEYDARSARERDNGSHVPAVPAALAGGQSPAVRLEGTIQIGALHLETPAASSPNGSVNVNGGR